jgi:hypothetical protein
MTLPYERSRAVMAAAKFLIKLASPSGSGFKKIPAEVRAEARRLLKHYPHPWDLHEAAKHAPNIFDVRAGFDVIDEYKGDAAV